jgi:integrase
VIPVRKTLTDRGVEALKPRPKRYAYPDPELRGHFVRVTPNGAKSFVAVTRNPDGKQLWTTLGVPGVMTIAQARVQGREVIQRVRAGLPAIEPRAESFGAVVENWLKRHVEANGLRSAKEIRRLLAAHILPAWRDREFVSIRRSDVAALLDEVEDGHSARQADAVLSIIRAVMNWFAARHDDYVPPVVKGMHRRSAHAQARARVLGDDEIRQVWLAAEPNGTFGAIARICLLTAQRSRKVAAMRWDEIEDGAWTVPAGPREKGTGGTLVLPKLARDIIEAQPRLASNPHVFAGRGEGPHTGWSKGKRRIDEQLPEDMRGWVLHDLRRTARSLMSRAGVPREHAERVLGHVIGGIEQVYDRHQYKTEKGAALAKLAALIDSIVHPRSADVLPMKGKKQRREVSAASV